MLIRFRVSNFRSLKEEQELVLTVGSGKEEKTDAIIPTKEALGVDLLRSAVIYGANASGKTNVIRAMRFMQDAVLESQRQWQPGRPIPRQPFLLDILSKTETSLFEVDLLLSGIRYTYGFEIDSMQVVGEWLYAYPRKKPQMWFTRHIDNNEPVFQFGKYLTGRNHSIAKLTRDNSLFLSAAAQNNHELLAGVYNWFSTSLKIVTGGDRSSLQREMLSLCVNEGYKNLAVELLKMADLGIVDMDIKEEPFADKWSRTQRGYVPDKSDRETMISSAFFTHAADNPEGSVSFPLEEESSGTQALFGLLGPLTSALGLGQTLLVDELETSLHPNMALWVVQLVNSGKVNLRNGQLIFNTHDSNLLDAKMFRRDQVWFVEKDAEGSSHLYPLWKYKPRKDENLGSGYLVGRYGAIPFLTRPEGLFEEKDDE